MEFISEPITPERGSFTTAGMTQGLASLPRAFTWRGKRYEIVECLEHEKRTATEGHTATGDRYLRRQEFLVRLDSGQHARLYVTRQAALGSRGASKKRRWFLYSITQDDQAS
jgi:hypothetical protein